MRLAENQQLAFDAYKRGDNVFLTGPGGSGKTALIKHVYDKDKDNIQLTALTGVAAIQLHETAKTIHSWAGIGLGDNSVSQYVNKINNSKVLKNKWKNIKVLVIDEVSMLSADLFEKLELIARTVRNSDELFGGIQLIFSGDFYQLPPVKNNSKFCFESPLFDKLFTFKILLDTIFRQKDATLLKILKNIRMGKITKSNIKTLNARITNPDDSAVILMPRKMTVDEINTKKLNELDTESKKYERIIVEDLELTKEEEQYMKLVSLEEYSQELEFLEKNTVITQTLELKIGCRVMSIINVEEEDKLVISNGTQGIVTDFSNGLPIVEFENGVKRTIGYYTWKCHSLPACGTKQIPLILSWALTIHKAQGCTLNKCRMNIGNDIFEAGQTYVALSRVKSLEGIFLDDFNPYKIKVNEKVKIFYQSIML